MGLAFVGWYRPGQPGALNGIDHIDWVFTCVWAGTYQLGWAGWGWGFLYIHMKGAMRDSSNWTNCCVFPWGEK